MNQILLNLAATPICRINPLDTEKCGSTDLNDINNIDKLVCLDKGEFHLPNWEHKFDIFIRVSCSAHKGRA
jgi:hypothetical protein